ncbi:MAG: Sugar phosphate isomerase, epimerase family protein YcjR [Herbinix sp.]|jgi:sugar phosphate isomerase/epimerase|nr:Sugar phosphate isomerase, epimerase family protein YcjR [Herbinix sp.]
MLLGTQDRDFFPKELVEKFRFVKSIGFDCFEIDGKLLVEQLEQVKEAIKDSGLPVTTACGGYRGWIGDFIEEKRFNGVEDLKAIIRALKEVGGKGVVIPAAWGMFTFRLPPMVSPRSREGDRKAILASLKELEITAKENDIYLYLEPLNRYQDHMLNTLQDAVDVIEAGNFEMVKITADFYHMAIEEDDISEALVKHQKHIGHIHIAENHRYQPGTGSIDFKRHINTLKRIGYDGPIVNEGRIRGEDPLKVYIDSIGYMRQFM